jgi:predicted CxxxxCH...CXXCH cytochrome family protein
VVDGDKTNEDLSDCAQCHGATVTSYTYASGGNHMNGTTDFVVDYNDNGTRGNLADDTDTTCTSACHATPSGQAADWVVDTSLACDACHGNPPADGGGDNLGHSKHLALAGVTCATCHDGTVPTDASHANDASGTEGQILADRGVADADEASLLEASWDDINNTCNNAACHNPNGGYLADWDVDESSCNLCHGNAPATGAHAEHTMVSQIYAAEDRSDCALCHIGADSYTYAHRDGASAFVAGIADGGTAPNVTCTAACHSSTAGDGSWQDADSALNCTACHGNPPANGGADGTAHADHLAAGLTCGSCHDITNGTPTDTTHISAPTGTDGQKIADKATADAAEVLIEEVSWNGVAETCSNAACHNPSGTTYSADWTAGTGSTSSCTLCHSNTDPGTGSHSEHISLDAKFNANGQAACADCHTVPVSNTHRNGTKDVNGAKIAGWTTPNCTTSCHANGVAATGTSPDWGVPSADCTICHTAPPNTGDHGMHLSGARTTLGMTCNSCHGGTSADSATAAGVNHMDGSRYDIAAGGNYDSSPVTISSYVQGSPSTCNASCHTTGNPKSWEVPTNCEGCHSNLAADTTHAAHITIAPSIIADTTECQQCHGVEVASYTVGGGHANHQTGGPINFAAGMADGGASPNWTCSAACHSTATGTTTLWSATSLACDACHGNAPATGGGDNTAHTDHITAGLTCGTCHDVTNGTPTDLTHITDTSGANEGAVLTGRAQALVSEVLIQEASWNGTNNTCNNTSCHNPSGGAYLADWDTSTSNCALCHGNAPATGAHAEHTLVVSNTTGEDRSDCALCHTGADSYTYAHRDGASAFVAGIADGGTAPNVTCTAACHSSTAGDGSWQDADSALNCTACHGNPPANGGADGTAHADHLAAGLTCGSCHDITNGTPTDTTHISAPTGTDGQKIADKATADAAEVLIEEVSWNGVAETCSNAACHNPSGTTYSADWTAGTGSTSSCTLCHSNTDPGTGSHSEHISLDAKFNANGQAACADCHTVPVSNTHRNGTKDVNGAKIAGWTTPNCTTSCHANGVAATGTSPDWGVPSADCTICHTAPPNTGDHGMHLSGARTTLGMTCNSCHGGTSADSATAAGVNHMDGSRYDIAAGGNYDSSPVTISSYVQGSPSTCNASCHTTGNPKSWEVPTNCEGCHSNLAADTTHAAHITIAPSIIADTTECQQCHGVEVASYTVGGGHANHQTGGPINFAAGMADGGASPNWTCSAACHSTATGTTTLWSATSLACDACHGNAPATGGGDNTAHTDHITAGLTCGTCHDVTNGTPTDLTHITDTSGANEGAVLTGRAQALVSEVLIQEASWNGTNNTCNNTSCHNPSGGAYLADWDTSTSNCALCHADTSGDPGTGSHTAHRTAGAVYGSNVACSSCHTVPVANSHRNGIKDVNGSAISTWTSPNCSTWCHSNGIAATGTSPDWGTASATTCGTCHASAPATNSHGVHIQSGATGYGSTTDNSTALDYDFGCGECHGTTLANHLNGSKSLDVGTGWNGTTCSTNACHQDGKGGAPVENPNWATGFSAGDRCAKCHLNSPAGGSHSAHVVGIHYKKIFSGGVGLATAGNTNTSSHGSSSTSTTISCNVCHNSTVTTSANDKNSLCVTCHDNLTAPLMGDALIADKSRHLDRDGTPDVAFASTNIKSKAQIRGDITSIALYNTVWQRNVGYKAAGAYDSSKALLSTGSYAGGSCSNISCHNNQSETWGSTSVSCASCHPTLP